IADSKLIFVDVGVVNPIDGEAAQDIIVHEDVALVMFEPEGLEKILIDDDGARGNNGIDHIVANEIDDHLFQARGNERPSKAENDGALIVAQHRVVNLRGSAEIAGGKR